MVGRFVDFHTARLRILLKPSKTMIKLLTTALNEAANPNPANDVLHGMEASVQCHLGFVLAKWSFREA